MRKIDFINEAIISYQGINSDQYKGIWQERTILSTLRTELEWQYLSAPEKQQKRKNLLSSMRKMQTPMEELKKIFALELCIIEFYDLLQNALDILESIDGDKISVTRLKAMFFVEKVLINEVLNAKQIRHHNFSTLSQLLNEYSNDEDFTDIDLQNFNKKLIEKEYLLNNASLVRG